MSEFDMRQLLVFEEALVRNQPLYGRAEARRRAAAQMPLVLDTPAWQAAASTGDSLLPSYLAAALGGVAQRADWPSRRSCSLTRHGMHIWLKPGRGGAMRMAANSGRRACPPSFTIFRASGRGRDRNLDRCRLHPGCGA
jgi:hypothetical protein